MIQPWMTLRVARKWREAEDVFSFELVDPAGGELPPFTAGSHVDVEVGPGLIRQYSLCNDPASRDRYQIAVLREPQSRGGSLAMADLIGQGQDIRVSQPRNHFELEPAAGHSVLIAGGIGITPILCMAERLANTDASFEMHYVARSRGRAAFLGRIADSAFANKVALHFGDERRIDLDAVLSKPAHGAHLYVCGPTSLIEAALVVAKAKGWSDAQVHREFFAATVDIETLNQGGGFTVRLASSGREIEVPDGAPITQALAEAGIDVPTSCEEGVCGTCLTRVLEGEPDHRDSFLTDSERAANDQMTLCCSRSKTPLLVLDL